LDGSQEIDGKGLDGAIMHRIVGTHIRTRTLKVKAESIGGVPQVDIHKIVLAFDVGIGRLFMGDLDGDGFDLLLDSLDGLGQGDAMNQDWFVLCVEIKDNHGGDGAWWVVVVVEN